MKRASSTEQNLLNAFAKLKIPQEEKSNAQRSDNKDRLEINDWMQRAQYIRYMEKTKLIRKYAARLFGFMVVWTIIVIVIVVLDGIEKIGPWVIVFNLPASVLVALVSTTMIQVIGLFAYVAYYLFKSNKD